MSRDDTGPAPLDGILPRIRVTREIPLWGILTVLGALAVQAIALYYGLQRQVEEQARQGQRMVEIAADVRSIGNEIQKNNMKTLELSFGLAGLEQRVRLLEARPVPK